MKKLRKRERKKQINNYSAFIHTIQIYFTVIAYFKRHYMDISSDTLTVPSKVL